MDRENVIKEFEKICEYTLRSHEFRVLNDVLALLKEQEKPNGKCVNECECWDSAYERGKQDALKEQEVAEPKWFIDAHHPSGAFRCGSCGERIVEKDFDFYCSKCGKAVKWK